MRKPDRIDFDRLLGFELLTRELSRALDFQDENFGAKLGAKVGGSEDGPAKTIEFAKLLGFDSVADGLGVVDFKDERVSDKLGAKIGPEVSPAKGINFKDETLGAKLGAKVGLED
jgi:hypothetical protein